MSGLNRLLDATLRHGVGGSGRFSVSAHPDGLVSVSLPGHWLVTVDASEVVTVSAPARYLAALGAALAEAEPRHAMVLADARRLRRVAPKAA